ncbi:MAG: hypothetical protein AAF591_07200 [Verrucomicrobiota bacterium]
MITLTFALTTASANEPHRATYSKDLKIHVGTLGETDGKPLTRGDDFKPVWSKTGDNILFFRRLANHPQVSKWKTAVFHMNADGTMQHQLTSGKFTDFNHTWTRDGTNTPIWNRQKPSGRGGYTVMAGKIGGNPGEEIALTGDDYHAWAFTCLEDGRIFVNARPPGQERGYFLMTPDFEGTEPTFEPVTVPLAMKGVLDRVSISPDEKKICFEFQTGFERKVPGRTLYLADFDSKAAAIRNAKPFANKEGKSVWFAYPRWTKDQSAIMYHAGGKLFLYSLADESTTQVSVNEEANYIYPHGEATPK